MSDNRDAPQNLSALIKLHTETLLRNGYCVIQDALPGSTIADLDRDLRVVFDEVPFGPDGFDGATIKRFGRLLVRSTRSAALIEHRLILGIVESVLLPWCERNQLISTLAIAVHPGAPAQLAHRDQDVWRGPTGEVEYLVHVLWPLTPFTHENGGTRIWLESHGRKALEAPGGTHPFALDVAPGSALLVLGSTLHAAGSNRSPDVHRSVVVGYALGWLTPPGNQWRACPPHVVRTPPGLAKLEGFCQQGPNLDNVEGQCPSVLLGDHAAQPLGSVDTLRPDQEALIVTYVGQGSIGVDLAPRHVWS